LSLSGGLKILVGLAVAAIALTGGLAAGCFVKAFGVTFLGKARSQKAQKSQEASLSMKIPMVFLGVLALCFGLFAPFILGILMKVSGSVLSLDITNIKLSLNNFSVFIPTTNAYASSLQLIIILALAMIFVLVFVYYVFGKAKIKKYNTWDCGYYKLSARNEYTSTAFSKPFRIAFSFFLKPYKKTEKIRDSFYHVRSFKYEVFTTPVFKRYIYDPILQIVFKSADQMKKIQPGSIHLYIAYIFITVIVLIILLNRI